MLHTKPQGHWLFGSGEEIFDGFLPYMGVAAILVMWARPREQTFIPPSHWGSASTGQVVWRRRSLKMVDRWTADDGQMTEHAYTVSSAMSLKAQVS